MEKLSVCIIESRNSWHVFAVRLHLSLTNRFGSSLSLAFSLAGHSPRYTVSHREFRVSDARRFEKRVLRCKGDMVGTGQSAQEEKLQAQETKLGDSQSTFKR